MWDVPDIDLAVLEVSWLDDFTAINGILFVGNVSPGYEQETRARLVPNPQRCLPASLAPLAREHRLAYPTGFPARTHRP